MKTASVRDLRQDFARVYAWLQAGEDVTITRRRQPIATLVTLRRKKRVNASMPDLTARLQKVFGRRVIPDQAVKDLMDRNRGAF